MIVKNKRKRCTICNKLTENWQRINYGPWHCYDGCYSTTGKDKRTKNGKPQWEK
jgi:hypothetical protein